MSKARGVENLNRFTAFVSERDRLGDWEDYVLKNKLDLNKKMIARDCEFDRKRITENSAIFDIYKDIKNSLLKKGILHEDNRSAAKQHSDKSSNISNSLNKVSLKKQQESNAALQEELYSTQKKLFKAEEKLRKLENIENYLLETGRL
ncbi:hypothetical protein [Pseudoalteromonas arctica]|uniref:Uncharacterized protein n=1 Tax=Pseudoalteromonas arctica TaxID=394751 RepID=A0ABU9TCG8_9GAMM